MKAGRELDAAVAEEVMGLRDVKTVPLKYQGKARQPGLCHGPQHDTVPHYSTDIEAAWEVVERVVNLGWLPTLGRGWSCGRGAWCFEIVKGKDDLERAMADSAPEAICLAALKAVGA